MNFPSKPNKAWDKTPDGKIRFPIAYCEYNSATLGVTFLPRETFNPANSESLLDAMLINLNQQSKENTLIFKNKITVNGYVGAELGATVISPKGYRIYMRQRTILTESHAIQILIAEDCRRPLAPWVSERFFNSLAKSK